jgi:hypothetical protein
MSPDRDAAQTRKLEELSSLLSAMALETATARRDARRLRQENAALRSRLSRVTFGQPRPRGGPMQHNP